MKNKCLIAFFVIMALLIAVSVLSISTAASDEDGVVLTATEASEWTSLFDRRGTWGWLGADGIYSVALDGNDAFGSATEHTDTFFIFSDTLMGIAEHDGSVIKRADMPAQSSALLHGNIPAESEISFVYGEGGSSAIGEHLFGEHKWMLDCLVHNDTLYILGFPEENWKPQSIDMISIPIENGAPAYEKYEETENIAQLWHRIGDEYLYAFGIGITANTVSAGAPAPDGYIYVYGYRDAIQEMSRKDLIVGRIHESDFPNFARFTYWNGDGWCDNIEDSAILLSDISCEMSVSFVPTGAYAGKYIAVYTRYTRSSDIMYAIGDTPYGPFDTPVKCYHATENGEVGAGGEGARVVYNAKAHPHLSKEDMLLVSYNVNVEGEGAEQWTTDYHPRFLWIDLDPTTAPVSYGAPSDVEINTTRNAVVFLLFLVVFFSGYCAAYLIKRKSHRKGKSDFT